MKKKRRIRIWLAVFIVFSLLAVWILIPVVRGHNMHEKMIKEPQHTQHSDLSYIISLLEDYYATNDKIIFFDSKNRATWKYFSQHPGDLDTITQRGWRYVTPEDIIGKSYKHLPIGSVFIEIIYDDGTKVKELGYRKGIYKYPQ